MCARTHACTQLPRLARQGSQLATLDAVGRESAEAVSLGLKERDGAAAAGATPSAGWAGRKAARARAGKWMAGRDGNSKGRRREFGRRAGRSLTRKLGQREGGPKKSIAGGGHHGEERRTERMEGTEGRVLLFALFSHVGRETALAKWLEAANQSCRTFL